MTPEEETYILCIVVYVLTVIQVPMIEYIFGITCQNNPKYNITHL